MFFLLSGGQEAFLLKRSVCVNKPPLKRDCSQIDLELFAGQSGRTGLQQDHEQS